VHKCNKVDHIFSIRRLTATDVHLAAECWFTAQHSARDVEAQWSLKFAFKCMVVSKSRSVLTAGGIPQQLQRSDDSNSVQVSVNTYSSVHH